MSPPRRAGSPWRLLVHEWVGAKGNGVNYGRSHSVSNNPNADRHPDNHMSPTVLEGTEFDELVVGRWLHVEQTGTGSWWVNVGGVTVNITADRDGRPKRVVVSGPEDMAGPVDGCVYVLDWSGPAMGNGEL